MSNLFSARNYASGARAPSSDLIQVTEVLCQAFLGSHPLVDALRHTAQLIGADIASISRVEMRCEPGRAKVLSYGAPCQLSNITRNVDVSFARVICGNNLPGAKLGSVWFGCLDDFEDNEALTDIFQSNRLTQSVVILLDRKNENADFLELHFGHQLPYGFDEHLSLFGVVLSDCWNKRALGQVLEVKLSKMRSNVAQRRLKDILSLENPCQLSRAEFRVCSLLARGLNNKALLFELSISISTLRTHLRNIYAKTGVSTQPELIHYLLSPAISSQPTSSDRAYVA